MKKLLLSIIFLAGCHQVAEVEHDTESDISTETAEIETDETQNADECVKYYHPDGHTYISECIPGDEQDAIMVYIFDGNGCVVGDVLTLCSQEKRCRQIFNETEFTEARCYYGT